MCKKDTGVTPSVLLRSKVRPGTRQDCDLAILTDLQISRYTGDKLKIFAVRNRYFSKRSMERNLDKHLDDTFRVPGVAGVICTDEHGLCLGAKGVATKESAGHIANIAESAARLNPNMPNPVIAIEGEGGSILIKKEDNITMGIYKSPN